MNLNQVTLPTTQMEASAKFYQTLGLTFIVNSMPHYARFVCPNGNSTLSLSQVDTPPTEPGIHIYFECDDLDGEVERLKAVGLSFLLDPVDQPWLWREARLKDPDGHLVILFHAGENRLNPPWKVK